MPETRGQEIADRSIIARVHDRTIKGIALFMFGNFICWEVEGTGKLEQDAAAIKSSIAREIDRAYALGVSDENRRLKHIEKRMQRAAKILAEVSRAD